MKKPDTKGGMQFTPYSEESDLLNMSIGELPKEQHACKKMKMPDFSKIWKKIEGRFFPFEIAS